MATPTPPHSATECGVDGRVNETSNGDGRERTQAQTDQGPMQARGAVQGALSKGRWPKQRLSVSSARRWASEGSTMTRSTLDEPLGERPQGAVQTQILTEALNRSGAGAPSAD